MKAKLNYVRIAPRKVRLVADAVRSKGLDEAMNILRFSKKKSAKPLAKLLNSAASNAKSNSKDASADLYISKITVDGGPVFKRYRARARGASATIRKKTSRITLVLSEKSDKQKIPTAKPSRILDKIGTKNHKT